MTSMGAETFLSILKLIEFILLAAARKNETTLTKTEQTWKKNKANESDLVNMRHQIQIL